MDYEKYLQNMKNTSIRTNILNQRLAELGENFPPLTAENYPMEGKEDPAPMIHYIIMVTKMNFQKLLLILKTEK